MEVLLMNETPSHKCDLCSHSYLKVVPIDALHFPGFESPPLLKCRLGLEGVTSCPSFEKKTDSLTKAS